MQFRILGPLEVLKDGRSVELGGAQQRALLAVLVLHRGEAVSIDRLIDALWGERPPATAVKTVQVYVSRLRKALGDGLLVTQAGGYLLAVEPDCVDAERFEELVREARRALEDGDSRRGAGLLANALDLCRGPPLGEFTYQRFAQSEIARLEEMRLTAVADRVDAELALGQHARLIGELEALVREHPSSERFEAQLMLALYRSGRQSDALASYRQARRRLVGDLGIEPSRTLQELERAMLAQDPTLEAPIGPSARQPGGNARRARRGGLLLAFAGAAVLASVVILAVSLANNPAPSVRVAPNSVAAIDVQSNRVVADVSTGTSPGAIAFGFRSLWIANIDDQTISRIDPTTLRTLRTLAARGPPTGIAAASKDVWVVQSNPHVSAVSVSRVDPRFDSIGPPTRLGNVVAGGAGAIAAQGDAVWVAPSSGLLARLDPTARRTLQEIDPSANPAGIAIGGGALWVIDSDADNVTRIDPSGMRTSIPVGNGPNAIAIGAGSVWVSDSRDDAVVRIDPVTAAVIATIPVGHSPDGVAVGAGSLWVANSGDGTVSRLDPRSNERTATIPVGGSPQAIVVHNQRVWVTVDERATGLTQPAEGGTLRMQTNGFVDNMDPALAYAPGSWQLLYATCAKLLNYPDKSGAAGAQLTAEVAQALPAPSPDGKSYTFTVRPGFRFSPPSNERVTAQTFKDTIERTLDPRMKNPVAFEFTNVVGASIFMARKAPHISGVIVRGETLTIHLLTPEPDILSRLAQPFFCAVPSNTPIDPNGVRVIPSAGPYHVTSYSPGREVVLVRNRNYHASRPHRLDRIELTLGISPQRAVADIEADTADFTFINGPSAAAVDALTSRLASRYGPGSPASARGDQRYYPNPQPELDFLALNTHRPLFRDVRMRRAVNYAVDRRALAKLGLGAHPNDRPTDQYLPPGLPGSGSDTIYPLSPDLAKASALAHVAGRTAVLYTCEFSSCEQQAEIIRTELAAIGLRVEVKTFNQSTLYARLARPGEPFDIAPVAWLADYPDPEGMLDEMLENSSFVPSFDDTYYVDRLAAAARLTGARRYLAYRKFAIQLARDAAPLVAYGNSPNSDFFSARVGCQTYGFYNSVDLAALCVQGDQHRRQ